MFLRKLFPYALSACFALGLFPTSTALAQSVERRPRQTIEVNEPDGPSSLAADPFDGPIALGEEIKPTVAKSDIGFGRFANLVASAIDERLGSRYRWGGTGPNAFDCSGFVWSIFQSAGINFERGSARTLWGRFEPATEEEQYKFGTLVFFSNLRHVGVVADEHGFYHASRHHGVVYSPFTEYWTARIDGFRRVPLPETQLGD